MTLTRDDEILIHKFVKDHGFECTAHAEGDHVCHTTIQQFVLGFRESTLVTTRQAEIPKARISPVFALGWVLGGNGVYSFHSPGRVDAVRLVGVKKIPAYLFCCARVGKETLYTLGFDTNTFLFTEWKRDTFFIEGSDLDFTEDVRKRLLAQP